MTYLQFHLLVVVIVWGYLLLLCGLLMAAAFHWFKPSPRCAASMFAHMACWSLGGFILGCCLVATYWNLVAGGRAFDFLLSVMPAGWVEIHFIVTSVGGCWGGGLLGAWAGRRFWRHRLHAPS